MYYCCGIRSYIPKGKEPVCPVCNQKMILDDIDYDFEGKQDEIWRCPNVIEGKCDKRAFVKVRYKKVCKIEIK